MKQITVQNTVNTEVQGSGCTATSSVSLPTEHGQLTQRGSERMSQEEQRPSGTELENPKCPDLIGATAGGKTAQTMSQ